MTEEQPCGHPKACIVSSDEGTHYCAWCADLAELTATHEGLVALQDACLDILEAAPKGHSMICRRMCGGPCDCWQAKRKALLDQLCLKLANNQ